jgi:hypothetical protein
MIELVADFETTSKAQYLLEDRTRVYLYGIKKLSGGSIKMGISIEDFFNDLLTYNDHLTIYFHNLSFDGEFILWYLAENNFEYDEETIKPNSFHNITTDLGIHYLIKCKLSNDKQVRFTCSYRMMPTSIESLGELVNVKKLSDTHDYTELKNYTALDDIPDEEINYLTNDLEILRLAIIKLKQLGLTQITASSSAYRNWQKTNFLLHKHRLIKPDNDEVNEMIGLSYKGGITKLNKRYFNKTLTDVISYDVNSMYPAQMLNNTMPVDIPIVYDDLESAQKDKTYKKHLVVVYVEYAKILKDYHSFIGFAGGFLQTSYEYKDEFTDEFLYLWYDEYKLFDMYYFHHSHIVKVVSFKESKNVFKKYIEHWKQVKETSDGVERYISKLMLNSLYGKFGQRDFRISKMLLGIEDDHLIYKDIEKIAPYHYRAIASYITSMARTTLIRAIQENADAFVYCDTDSIYLYQSEAKNIPIDEHKFGYWKFENRCQKFKALKSKCYIKTIEDGSLIIRISGLPRIDESIINYDTFKPNLKIIGKKKYMKRVKGGIIIDTTDFTIEVKDIHNDSID